MSEPPFELQEEVFVSCAGIAQLDTQETALYRTKVVDRNRTSVKVDLPNGAVSRWIQKARVHRNVGMLILELGDFVSEAATLDPLSKSITQYCRLLVSDDYIRWVRVRSLAEVSKYWQQNHGAYKYVIIVGHADTGELCTAIDGCRPVADWVNAFAQVGVGTKNFLISACKAGEASYARAFSRSPVCNYCIAPFQTVHSAISSQFIQSFLAFRFVSGHKEQTSFRYARDATVGRTSFRLWRAGKLELE